MKKRLWGWGLLILLATTSHADPFRQAPKAMSALRQGAAMEQGLSLIHI